MAARPSQEISRLGPRTPFSSRGTSPAIELEIWSSLRTPCWLRLSRSGERFNSFPRYARAIRVHRWNGRLFALTALGLSVSGLYTLWMHGKTPSAFNLHAMVISLNAVLIITFITLAWRSARRHEISTHRRWALRAYLVANAQWFTRVGFMAWFIVGRKLLGIGEGFDGTFFAFWDFGCYLVPLAVLELYLRAKQNGSPTGRFAMAGSLAVLTVLMGVGIFGFYMFTRPLLEAVK